MSHCEQVLQFMEEHGSITQQDAYRFKPHGCTRLPARISDLKRRGYDIDTVMETRKYEDGASVTYARYSLAP